MRVSPVSHQAELLALHERLVAGDIRAAHRIVETVIGSLKSIVGFDVPMHDVQDIEQVCFDAMLEYLQAPELYDPNRAQLVTYLAAMAKGKAMTLRRSNARRLTRDGKYELDRGFRGPSMQDLELDDLDPIHRAELIRDPGDLELLRMITQGVDELPLVARALDLPDDQKGYEQARRRLERMRGRLRRLKDKIGAQ